MHILYHLCATEEKEKRDTFQPTEDEGGLWRADLSLEEGEGWRKAGEEE